MASQVLGTRTKIHYGRGGAFGGTHTFGYPATYIRTGRLRITAENAHARLRQSLETAFTAENLGSIQRQLGLDLTVDKTVTLDFINWGNVQLVYRVTIAQPGTTLDLVALINQPQIPLGLIREEFDNLQRLAGINPRFVVTPDAYFTDRKHELYVAPYIEMAQCIFSDPGRPWGVFNPSPEYHFEIFSEDMRFAVTSTMIALLVAYYDMERERGLAQTHLSGDDFMLTQDFRQNDPATVLPNMRLIAARGWVELSLEDYLATLRREFRIGTHYRDPAVVLGGIKVNHKSGLPLTEDEIEAGIELGLSLRTPSQT